MCWPTAASRPPVTLNWPTSWSARATTGSTDDGIERSRHRDVGVPRKTETCTCKRRSCKAIEDRTLRSLSSKKSTDGLFAIPLRMTTLPLHPPIPLPDGRDEAWRYTSLTPLADRLGARWWQPLEAAPADPAPPPGLDAIDLMRDPLPEAIARTDEEAGPADDHAPFAARLAACFAPTVQTIQIAAQYRSALPLLLIHPDSEGAGYRRHALRVGCGAEVTLIELFAGDRPQMGLTCSHLSINLEPGARLTHYRLQRFGPDQFHLGALTLSQQRESDYRLHAIELGGALARLDLSIALQQPGAACALHGLFLLDGQQHADHQVAMHHAAPHCRSRADYRTVLAGRAHAVFNGRVVVDRGACGTDSAQRNANLLLSRQAEVDTKPELEIYNDDVRCAHGATVGQLDAEQLFYLRSRGLTEAEARHALVVAFADALLAGIALAPLRQAIESAAADKIAQEPCK
ncbi:MAG: Fe-S cluster assembly protein SufD [Zetaproteobacteria bacterium]|nr:MAG: Fe-S cluster assembly protein SufD [Zetaproteobacteria bacterium]